MDEGLYIRMYNICMYIRMHMPTTYSTYIIHAILMCVYLCRYICMYIYSGACIIKHPLEAEKQCWISKLLDYRGQFVW